MSQSTMTATGQHMEVPAGHGAAGHGGSSSAVSGAMFFWFLVIFGIAAYILKKHAFTPILENLDKREETIEKSLENAETLEREMAELDAKIKAQLDETDQKTRQMIDAAREAAKEAARGIEAEAKEKADILRENAARDLATAQGKAEASLRAFSAETAVELTMKLLNEKLDAKSRQALTDQLLAEI